MSIKNSQSTPITLLEAVEIFGEDARPVLQEKLDDLKRQEERFQDLLEAKVAAAKRTFKYPDDFTNWFLIRAVTLNTATTLAKMRREKKNIKSALLLATKGSSKDWEEKILRAKEFPIEGLYKGRLRKSGRNNLVGLCPFHSEKTPSFNISTDKNLFHCFGCLESGDVLTFLMKTENLDFKDAVRRLS